MVYAYKNVGDGVELLGSSDSQEKLIKALKMANIDTVDIQFSDIEPSVYIVPTVQELANNRWEYIKSIRNQKEQDGCSYMGSTLDSDSVSVQRINTVIQAAQTLATMGQGFNVDWTMQDNSVINMDSEDVMGMSIALVTMSNTLHQKARAYREQINQIVADFEAGVITEEAAKTALDAVDWQD